MTKETFAVALFHHLDNMWSGAVLGSLPKFKLYEDNESFKVESDGQAFLVRKRELNSLRATSLQDALIKRVAERLISYWSSYAIKQIGELSLEERLGMCKGKLEKFADGYYNKK